VYGYLDKFRLFQKASPDPYVDGCGFSMISLFAGIPFFISSGSHNISSSLGYLGTNFLLDERMGASNGSNGDTPLTPDMLFNGGMIGLSFNRKVLGGSYSNPWEPSRVYSDNGDGSYYDRSELTSFDPLVLKIVGPDGNTKIFSRREAWIPADGAHEQHAYNDDAYYFLTAIQGPVDTETGRSRVRKIQWDPNIDRIVAIIDGNDNGSVVDQRIDLTYSSGTAAHLSRLTQVKMTRGAFQKVWNLSESVTDGAEPTPGYLRRITSDEGTIQLYYDDVGRVIKIVNQSTNTGLPQGHIDFTYFPSNRVSSMRGPIKIASAPYEIKYSYPSQNTIERTDVLDGQSKSTIQVGSGSITRKDKFNRITQMYFSNGGKDLNYFGGVLPGTMQQYSYSTDVGGAGPFAYFSNVYEQGVLVVKRTPMRPDLTAFKEDYPTTGWSRVWTVNKYGKEICSRTGPSDQIGNTECYPNVSAGQWGEGWACLDNSDVAYEGTCRKAMIFTGATQPDGSPMPPVTIKQEVDPQAPWRVTKRQVLLGTLELPALTAGYTNGELTNLALGDRFKWTADQMQFFGPQRESVYPNGPSNRSFTNQMTLDAAGNLLTYADGVSGAYTTVTRDGTTGLATALKTTLNGKSNQWQTVLNSANVPTETYSGHDTLSYFKAGTQIEAYTSPLPSETKLQTRAINECDPALCNVPDQNGNFSCNQHADTSCTLVAMPKTAGLENANGPSQYPNGANLYLWRPTAAFPRVSFQDPHPSYTLHLESNQGQDSTQTLTFATDWGGQFMMHWESECVNGKRYIIFNDFPGLKIASYNDQACTQPVSGCYLQEVSAVAHPFKAKFVDNWEAPWLFCAPANLADPVTYTLEPEDSEQ